MDGAAEMPKSEFAGWLRRRIEERAPAAIVRFGDGEAGLLMANPEDPKSTEGPIRLLESQSGLPFDVEGMLAIKELVRSAFDAADMLGIGFDERFLKHHKAWMERLASFYAERVAAGRPPALRAHCMLHHHIREALPEMLTGMPVSAISCRDLKPVLEGGWGLEEILVYQVPSQHRVRDVDGAHEETMRGIPIWPDAHARVHDELTVRERGEVFLVGAGLFGKDLCVRIRDEGGIAIDMGSALDRIAGKLTRGPQRRVLDLHAAGLPAAEIAERLGRLYRTTVDHRRIEQALDDLLTGADAWCEQLLHASYAVIRFDALHVEVNYAESVEIRTCCLAAGGEDRDNVRPLGLWWRGDADAGPWSAMADDLHMRGIRDLRVALVRDLDGLPGTVESAFPRAEVRVASEPIEAWAPIRKAIERHGPFYDEQAATGLICLVLSRVMSRRRGTSIAG